MYSGPHRRGGADAGEVLTADRCTILTRASLLGATHAVRARMPDSSRSADAAPGCHRRGSPAAAAWLRPSGCAVPRRWRAAPSPPSALRTTRDRRAGLVRVAHGGRRRRGVNASASGCKPATAASMTRPPPAGGSILSASPTIPTSGERRAGAVTCWSRQTGSHAGSTSRAASASPGRAGRAQAHPDLRRRRQPARAARRDLRARGAPVGLRLKVDDREDDRRPARPERRRGAHRLHRHDKRAADAALAGAAKAACRSSSRTPTRASTPRRRVRDDPRRGARHARAPRSGPSARRA